MTAYKIAVIGGGANGVSVLNELINQTSNLENSNSFEITLYEKSGVYGAGLAYGTHLDAHILNMPANSMSAVAGDDEHFYKWLKQPHNPSLPPYFNKAARGTDFVPRKVFGIYLEELYRSSLAKAARTGIKVNIKNEEVFDISEQPNHLEVITKNGVDLFDQTLICIGNQPPTMGKELKDIQGYFHHAWPEKKIMEGIANDQPVYIIGTSLTALDAFITLKEKGHTGKITMISRHGILPKVRMPSDPYKLKYLSKENISEITSNGQKKVSLDEIIELFEKEFDHAGAKKLHMDDVFAIPNRPHADVLKEDIELAQKQDNKHFSVLKAIDENIGFIWNSINFEDRQRFDNHYKAFWNAFDYPMPMQNALKLLDALESGQLEVKGGFRKLKYDPIEQHFTITRIGKDKSQSSETIEVKTVINAAGQGTNVKEMEAPIIFNTLESGTFTPHLFGGIDVDFETGAVKNSKGKASDKLYAVGSLTRGVHFYTNSINENAKCGKRTVSAMVDKAVNELKLNGDNSMNKDNTSNKIALFIGSDISSHLLMNELIPQMIEEGFEPSVYFTKHRASKKPVLPDIKQQAFFERVLLNEHVYPYLDKNHLQQDASCHSPKQISEIYDIEVKEIESVNDPDFIKELEQSGINAGVVVRCYQKFGSEIINFFNNKPDGALWNLHPGILPYYRGVMTYFRSMNDGKDEAGYSLHEIDLDWDAGPLIAVNPQPLDLTKAMLTNYCEIAPSGVPVIIDNLKKLRSRQEIEAIPQSEDEKGYHTFPTKSEMKEFKRKGLSLVDFQYMRKVIADKFSVPNTAHHQELSKRIDLAILEETGIDIGGHYGYLNLGLPG